MQLQSGPPRSWRHRMWHMMAFRQSSRLMLGSKLVKVCNSYKWQVTAHVLASRARMIYDIQAAGYLFTKGRRKSRKCPKIRYFYRTLNFAPREGPIERTSSTVVFTQLL